MGKKVKSLLAGVLALVVAASTVLAGPSITEAAKTNTKTVTVATQKELDKALRKDFSGTIVIKTKKSVKLTVPSGSFKKAELKVVAPNATITNKATFSGVTISDAKTVTEQGKNNKYQILDKKMTFTVSKKASVSTLNVAAKNGNIKLAIDGKVSKVSMDAKAKIDISGKTTSKVNIVVKKKDAQIVTKVKSGITLYEDARVTLGKGAKDSAVKVINNAISFKVANKSGKDIVVKNPDGKKLDLKTGSSINDKQMKEAIEVKEEQNIKPEEQKPETQTDTTPETKPETTPETKPDTTPDTKPETTPETKPETNPDTKPETKPETNPEQKPEESIYDGYTLKWEDDFNGTALNRDDWNVELHEPGWVNAELQEYVDSEANIQVKDGALYIKPVKESKIVTKNLLKNADFAKELEGWTETIANWDNTVHADASHTFGENSVTYDIKDAGDADWNVQLKQTLPLTGGKNYRISYTIVSTADRTIGCGVQDPTNGAYAQYTEEEDKWVALVANTPKNIAYEIYPQGDDEDAELFFSMGKIADVETPASVITISNVVVAELDEAGNPIGTEEVTYTSGRVNTQNKHDFKYGLFEVRAKVPAGQGYLPAFWMMPTDENLYGQWPRCGEIDCMEVMGQTNKKLYGTIHYGNPHSESQGTYTLTDGNFTDEFHTFTTEWEPGCIKWYVDGKLYHTENDWYSTTEGQGTVTYPAPFDQPFYMILNLAIGGSWVGYPDENTTYDNQAFVIDYVRAYQKDSYNENVTKPVKDVILRDPDANGNYIYNGDFATAEALDDDTNWKFMTALGGAATATIADKTMTIATTDAGTVDYSVQLVQAGVPFEKGAEYTVSFKAKADEARRTNVAVKAPDRGYQAYVSKNVDLTTEYQTFTVSFKMTADSDANGRLEYNMGAAGSTATIYIQDVKIEKTKAANPNEVEEKTVRADGNFVYNGSFQEGEGRLGYWTLSEGVSAAVTSLEDKRRLKADVVAGATISQDALALVPGQYAFSFDAQAGEGKSVTVTVAGISKTFELAATKQSYIWKLTLDDTQNRDFKITFNQSGIYYLDNVRLVEDSMIKNGSFSAGMAGFEVYTEAPADASYVVDSQKEASAMDFTIKNTGDAEYKIQLKQSNVTLENGHCYKLSFDIKSSIARTIQYSIQRDGNLHNNDWTPYVQANVPLDAYDEAGTYTTIVKYFKMEEATDDKSIFNIALGGGNNATQHRVCIDNIVLEEVAESELPSEPTLPEEVGENLLNNGNFSNGNDGWSGEAQGKATAEWSFNDKAEVNISSLGGETANTDGSESWHVSLKQYGLTLQKGCTYEVKATLTSNVDRTVKFASMDSTSSKWYVEGDNMVSLTAGTPKNATFIVSVGDNATDDNAYIGFDFGKINQDTPDASIVSIDDVSLIRISGEPEEDASAEPSVSDCSLWTLGTNGGAGSIVSQTKDEIILNVTSVGQADDGIAIKYENFNFKSNTKYHFSFEIAAQGIATPVVRSVKPMAFNDSWGYLGGYIGQPELAADGSFTKVDIWMEPQATGCETALLRIGLGYIKTDKGEELNSPTGTFVIKNITMEEVPQEA